MSKVSELSALSLLTYDDILPVVDVSDTTQAASGTTKSVTAQLLATSNAVYSPMMYGAVGDGSTDDTAAVQAAIDAAEANGGGIVALCGKSYRIISAASGYVGPYGVCEYGVKVDSDNVFIIGPGTIIQTEWPATGSNRWITILFTKEWYTGSPGVAPGEDGDWIENVGVIGVTFDNTAISYATRAAGRDSLTSNVNFAHARRFFLQNNLVLHGYGDGAMYCILGNQFGTITNNIVHGVAGHGFLLDGIRGCVVAGNRFYGQYFDATERFDGAGITIFANSDNGTNSADNIIADNICLNTRGGLCAVTGIRNKIERNKGYWTTGASTAISIHFGDNVQGEFPSTATEVRDNTLIHSVNIPTGVGIYITGKTTSTYDGSPLTQDGIVIFGNRVSSHWQAASVEFGEQVHDSWVINNILGDDIVEDVTCTGNTIAPNY